MHTTGRGFARDEGVDGTQQAEHNHLSDPGPGAAGALTGLQTL